MKILIFVTLLILWNSRRYHYWQSRPNELTEANRWSGLGWRTRRFIGKNKRSSEVING